MSADSWLDENLTNPEEIIYFLQKMIWNFFKGKKYDPKNYLNFLGFLQKKFCEREYLILNKHKDESPSEKEFTKEMFYQVMLKLFSNSIAK